MSRVHPKSALLGAVFQVLCLGLSAEGKAQDLEQTISFETDTRDEGLWILGFRPAIGIDDDMELFPQIGLVFGRSNREHLYLGGHLGARLTRPVHVRLGLRGGLFFESADFTYGIGLSLGLISIPQRHLLGFVPTWGLEGRYRLSGHHFLTLFGEADLLFEDLGFRENGAFLNVGLGWTIAF